MATEISVQKELKRIGNNISKTLIDKVITASLNKTATSTRAEVSRLIRKESKIKAKDIKARVYARKYRRKGDPRKQMKSSIIIYTGAIPLIKFAARAKKVRTDRGQRIGVTAAINGRRSLIRGAFLARSKSGYQGVFKRVGRSRLPIKEEYSNELDEIINSSASTRHLKRFIDDRFQKTFRQEFDFRVQKALNKA